MKKGYYYAEHADYIPDNYDYVWIRGAYGTTYDQDFIKRWAALNPFKRGIVFVPVLSATDDTNDNASLHLQLLQENNPAWRNTEAPIIIDYLGAPADKRLSYDMLRVYVGYIRQHWQPNRKVLLRAPYSVWAGWLKEQPILTKGMFDVIEPLVARWGAITPGALPDYGLPAWWEYQSGVVAYDSTRTWSTSPNTPVTPADPITPEPEPATPPVVVSGTVKRWHITGTLGGMVVDITADAVN